MRPVTIDQPLFDRLIDSRGRDLISIFFPTHWRGRDVDQDRIRLKNALSEAGDVLADRGWKPRERAQRLSAATSLDDDVEFWEHQRDGLALFIHEDGAFETASLGWSVDQGVYVLPVFVSRPLLDDLLASPTPALALTRNEVTLFDVTANGAAEADASLPESMDDVNWFVDREPQSQRHSDRRGNAGIQHGHEPSDRESADRDRFLKAVADELSGSDEPLVVLGDDDLVARFGAVARVETVSPKNSGLSSPIVDADVWELAHPILEDRMLRRERELVGVTRDKLGAGNGTADLREALQGAISGRLDLVIFDRTAPPTWGRVDTSNLDVSFEPEPGPEAVDLLDRLVVEALNSGATVIPVGGQLLSGDFLATTRF